MAEHTILLPEMGEGVMEATVIRWIINEGDEVDADEELVEIATDKVDSEILSIYKGRISNFLVSVGDVVKIGDPIAIIQTEDKLVAENSDNIHLNKLPEFNTIAENTFIEDSFKQEKNLILEEEKQDISNKEALNANLFLSPLVKSLIFKEKIFNEELLKIIPTGFNNRITKIDVLDFLEKRNIRVIANESLINSEEVLFPGSIPYEANKISGNDFYAHINERDEIIEIDRMRKIISDHMTSSKNTAVHVTSFVESDVTKIVNWRNKHKDFYKNREGESLTFTPIFVEAIIKSLQDFPMLNITFDGKNIIKKKNINIGIATALPNGNLIVPVVKNADKLTLLELSKEINYLIFKARNNKLQPKDITEATYTISNIGTFGNIIGTPIINQPQVAIMAIGSIKKKPSVIETKEGDYIGIRSKMFLSHSYDHRIIDGFLGGSFAQRVCEYLEAFDINREI